MSRRIGSEEWARRWEVVLNERDAYRAALESIAGFEPSESSKIDPYVQIAIQARSTAREVISRDFRAKSEGKTDGQQG